MKRENQEEILGRHNHLWSVPLLQRESNRVNNYAIDSAGIGEALQRSAASFNAANTDLSKSIALITATNEVVQDPDSVGKKYADLYSNV